MDNTKQREFRRKLKEEWKLLWTERFNDKIAAEQIAVRDYPLLFMDRGLVIFASRDAMAPRFSEIVAFWASQGTVCAPDPSVGGWGKFIRTELRSIILSGDRKFENGQPKHEKEKQQMKKSGRGWLHK
jgi:hypothetical protein